MCHIVLSSVGATVRRVCQAAVARTDPHIVVSFGALQRGFSFCQHKLHSCITALLLRYCKSCISSTSG